MGYILWVLMGSQRMGRHLRASGGRRASVEGDSRGPGTRGEVWTDAKVTRRHILGPARAGEQRWGARDTG